MSEENTIEFIRLMSMIDYKRFNVFLDTVKDMDIGQYVRRMAEEQTGVEEGDHPSDVAIEILRELVNKYPKEVKKA